MVSSKVIYKEIFINGPEHKKNRGKKAPRNRNYRGKLLIENTEVVKAYSLLQCNFITVLPGFKTVKILDFLSQ